jgi:hypothetical protein
MHVRTAGRMALFPAKLFRSGAKEKETCTNRFRPVQVSDIYILYSAV